VLLVDLPFHCSPPFLEHPITCTVAALLVTILETRNNNNNQAFYSQASWGRLEMKPHEQKKRYKTRAKRRKQRAIKNQIKKRRKDNKMLSQKAKKGREKKLTKGNKRKEPKIKVLAYELLAFTLSYLMLAPW
jgi:hypothetical protein